ncbi:MAG TPA: polysulfide reductase [Elusimicrobia bacterium]|nr:MAG: polysulfide reductase [Elusimicrobia bacterium GWA2_66_18]HAZ09446.1 polysulfide reductase [Elusimicrobiota bacterium]
MTKTLKDYVFFVYRCAVLTFEGDWRYFLWMTALTAGALLGLNAYCKQLVTGLSVTGMSDAVSWGLYIANFTFLVGMAAAAVMLVIPVYVYEDETLNDVVILGELLTVAVIVMCLLFVTVDLGRPDRFWHMVPFVGKFNWPISMLSWDVIVLNGYLAINAHICGYLVYMVYLGRKPSPYLYKPFVFLSIFWAISIHTVTAFLYVGLGGRPFWNAAIVAPRFLASAFTAGPGFLILTLRIVRRVTAYHVSDKALMMLRRIVQVSMIITVFLLFCELFKEFYTDSAHVASSRYLFFGLHGHHGLVPWIWTAMAFNTAALILLLLPVSKSLKYLDLACILAIVGIWIEKGMGMVIPAFIPTPLGEIVEYFPTTNEWLICLGIWSFGLLLYTIFLKMTIPVLTGALRPSSSTRP